MQRRKKLKLAFAGNLLLIAILGGYKVYLNIFERDFQAVHAGQVEAIQEKLGSKEAFSFAVVGNISNSIGIFERKIIPVLNGSDVDFLVSAGNAVGSGGEDKYRAIYRTLGHLEKPYLLTVGEHEVSNFGRFRFYKHFGPYFYSLEAGNSCFIFLDSTDEDAYAWQRRWLEEELQRTRQRHIFLFLSHPPLHQGEDSLLDTSDSYLQDPEFREPLLSLVERYPVTAVFSANLHRFVHSEYAGTPFITTGGAGGLVLNNDKSFYHYVKVSVDGGQVDIALERLDIVQYEIFRTLESLWLFVHSLFYVGYLNFILILSLLVLIGLKLYTAIFEEKDYYPNFDIDPGPYLERSRRVAMFTNNYLPFIGGVPISIHRLQKGLQALGHRVTVVAPRYRNQAEGESGVIRVPSIVAFGDRREFRLANIFSPRIIRRVRQFAPDIVHLHHPFWMGTLGLWIARRLDVPAVFTYHTRLEHYAHYVPMPTPLFRNLISHALVRRFANRCDGVVVPTQSAEDYLRIIGVRTDIFVLPTGIEYERFQKVNTQAVEALKARHQTDGKKVLVSVARLNQEKNIDFLLNALHELKRQQGQPFKCLLIGEGNGRARYQARIEQLGLEDCVTLVGGVPPEEVINYYHLGDVFVFASKSETQGMVLLEAMAAGLPVVAVRASGIDEVIQDGVNSYKTPENLGIWAGRVGQIMQDEELLREMGKNARNFASDHDIKCFAKRMEGVYAHVSAAYQSARQSGRATQRGG